MDVRIGQVDLTKPEKPGNSAKIADVKVRQWNSNCALPSFFPVTLALKYNRSKTTTYIIQFSFVLQIHEGFRKIGVGVKDDIAIVTLNKDVDE